MSLSKFPTLGAYFKHIDEQQAKRTEAKPVVHFEAIPGFTVIALNKRVSVVPVDHPAEYLNGDIVTTSVVVKVNDDGSFETLNTTYVPKA